MAGITVRDISAAFELVRIQTESRFPQAQKAKSELPDFLQQFVDKEYRSSRFDKSYFVTVVDTAQDANDLVILLLSNPQIYKEYKAIPSTEPRVNYPKAKYIDAHIKVREEEGLFHGMTYALAENYLAHIESGNK